MWKVGLGPLAGLGSNPVAKLTRWLAPQSPEAHWWRQVGNHMHTGPSRLPHTLQPLTWKLGRDHDKVIGVTG